MNHTFAKAIAVTTLGLAVAGFLPLVASADTVSVNFEQPTYSVGNVNGQDGWMKTGPYDANVTNVGIPASFGLQSLQISDAVQSGSFGDQTFSKALTDEAGETDALNGGMSGGTRQPHFEAQFDIKAIAPGSSDFVSISPDRGDGARMSYLRFEDNASGTDVFFYDVQGTSNPANFVQTQIATLDSTVPHTIKFVMDFVDGPSNDVVKIYIDNVLVHTGTSWENYYRFDPESNPTLVSNSRTVDSLLFREGGSGSAPNDLGKGFLIDNLSLASFTPEVPHNASISGTKYELIEAGHNKIYHTIHGVTIYLDLNNNGHLDGGEPSQVTDNNGKYTFVNLAAGTYHVREVLQSGWQVVMPSTGVYDLNLTNGQNARDFSFVNKRVPVSHGHDNHDKDHNGDLHSNNHNGQGDDKRHG